MRGWRPRHCLWYNIWKWKYFTVSPEDQIFSPLNSPQSLLAVLALLTSDGGEAEKKTNWEGPDHSDCKLRVALERRGAAGKFYTEYSGPHICSHSPVSSLNHRHIVIRHSVCWTSISHDGSESRTCYHLHIASQLYLSNIISRNLPQNVILLKTWVK